MAGLRGLLVAMASIAVLAPPASARPLDLPAPCVTFDDDAGTGAWGTPANWSGDRLPTAADDACISDEFPIVTVAEGTKAAARSLSAPDTSLAVHDDVTIGSGGVTVSALDVFAGAVGSAGPLSAGTVNLRAGSLGGAGALTLKVLRWTGGTLAGPATATVGALNLLGGTLNAPLVNTGTLSLASGMTLAGTGSLRNAAGAVVKTAGNATVAVPVDNDGTFESDGGVLTLTGGTPAGNTSTGAYIVGTGAVIDFNAGSYALAAPSATGPGTLRVSGGAVTASGAGSLGAVSVTGGSLLAAGALSAGRASLSGGTLGGTGTLALAGLDWSAGTVSGAGTKTVGDQGLTLSGAAAKSLADGTLVLNGPSTFDGPGGLTLDGAGQLENAGLLDIRSDLTLGSTGTGLIVNHAGGTIRKSGGGQTTIPLPLDNDGLLDVRAGTLRLTGGSGIGETSSGAYSIADGATLEWGAGAYALGAPTMKGNAAVTGATVAVIGTAQASSLTVSAGAAQFGGGLTADAVSLSGGVLTGSDMTVGQLGWTGGTLSGTGTATVAELTLGGDRTKVLRDRTLALTGASSMNGTGALQLAGTGRLSNGGTLDLRGDETILSSVPGATLTNTGTLRKSAGAGTANVALAVTNSGTVQVDSGRLQLGSLAGYDAATMTLGGGTYDVTGTLVVPDMVVVRNAAMLRLHGLGSVGDGTGDALAGLAANSGTLALADGAALALPGAFANSGTVRLDTGSLTTVGDYSQTGGLTSLGGTGSSLRGGTVVRLDGGSLEGAGTVAPVLRNVATVTPTGVLSIAGDYVQTAAGTLNLALPSQLAVSGAAALDGTLNVTGSAASGSYDVAAYGSATGQWTTVTKPDIPDMTVTFDQGAGAATLKVLVTSPVIPTPTATATATATATPDPTPQPGESAVIETFKGTVKIKQPGTPGGVTPADGFVPAGGSSTLPIGSVVDARKGEITFNTASSFTDPNKPPTSLTISSAIFQIRQVKAADAKTAVTDLLVQTPPGLARACVSAQKGIGTKPKKPAKPSKKTVRRIQATAKGLVRTFASAAVLTTRNATFEMRDRCDGTLASVKSGRAKIFDRILGRRHTLKARQARLVKAHLFSLRKLRLKKVPKP